MMAFRDMVEGSMTGASLAFPLAPLCSGSAPQACMRITPHASAQISAARMAAILAHVKVLSMLHRPLTRHGHTLGLYFTLNTCSVEYRPRCRVCLK